MKVFIRISVIILSLFAIYSIPRVKFYVHHGIWLPGFCENFHFEDYPDMHSLLGRDGDHTRSRFEIEADNIQALVDAIKPQSIWLRYSETDPKSKDSTLQCPCTIPLEAIQKKIHIMLYSSDTKGDYYNIWILPGQGTDVKVTISMPFT